MHVETFVDDISNRQDLPMMTEKDMLSLLLSTNTELGESEPEIAASIGEQMLHMNLSPLPKSIRVRIRDICSRVPPGNATLIGGGIGHLSAWLFDLWGTTSKDELITNRPHTFRIDEYTVRQITCQQRIFVIQRPRRGFTPYVLWPDPNLGQTFRLCR